MIICWFDFGCSLTPCYLIISACDVQHYINSPAKAHKATKQNASLYRNESETQDTNKWPHFVAADYNMPPVLCELTMSYRLKCRKSDGTYRLESCDSIIEVASS
jgi:hypothetical protein